MNEPARRKWVVGFVLTIGAAVLLTGINWGLPSKKVDPFLFPSGSQAENSTQSFQLSGAGLVRLAGGWDEQSDQGSDVSQHPIADRSQPITLIENPIGFSMRQILDAGDKTLPKLRDQQLQAWDLVQRLTADSNASPDDLHNAQTDYMHTGDLVNQYVDQYDQQHIPNYEQTLKQDNINRARIVMRYRLYSNQPDEMTTFRALGRMHPGNGDFDPRMYKYGGLWVYPVGALLKAASMINLVTLTSDIPFYLDRPEEFAKFYIVARAYSAAWGLVGALAVFAIARRLTASLPLAIVAALCFMTMPVVLDLAHEAKPHLPGAALTLLAILAAEHYVDTGKTRCWIITSILCGAAASMVLSDASALILIPAMPLIRRDSRAIFFRIWNGGILIFAAVYFATNPCVAAHLIQNRQLLTTNLDHSAAMYHIGSLLDGATNAARLLIAAISFPLAVAGILSLLISICIRSTSPKSSHSPAWLLTIVALIFAAQFFLFAADQTPDYARFGIIPAIALEIAAVALIAKLFHCPIRQSIAGGLLVIATAIYSAPYELGFLADCTTDNTRSSAANFLATPPVYTATPATPLYRPILTIDSEPAPYSFPPVNLYRWKIILLPLQNPTAANVRPPHIHLRPNDSFNIYKPGDTPISWANKAFDVTGSPDMFGR